MNCIQDSKSPSSEEALKDGFNQAPAANGGVLVPGAVAETKRGSFFLPGHDKTAASAVIPVEYGEIPEVLVSHGYGPEGKSPKQEVDLWRTKSKRRSGGQ